MSPDGSLGATDDFRLSKYSHLRDAGIRLPGDLLALDQLIIPDGPRDIGCCPYGSEPLEAGVDGRRTFPNPSSMGSSVRRREHP